MEFDFVVQPTSTGWNWCLRAPVIPGRDVIGTVSRDVMEIFYNIGGEAFLFRYRAEEYQDARGYAWLYARSDGPFDDDDAEALIELMNVLAEWKPCDVNRVAS